ncbi:2OG-Fe(II) oxygenase [Aliikangiella sp. IMCC44632]
MQNFIIEFKNALSPEYCDHLIKKFEAAKDKSPGRTGAGVDKSKKDSVDLAISGHPNWQQESQTISQTIYQATLEYAKMYPFILTGAISPAIQDPKSGQVRSITHEDIGQLNNQNIDNLVRSIYCMDNINMQRYTKGSGGYHHWHSEHYPHPNDPNQKSLHRVLLWLLYLNDIEQGGETEFFYQQAKVKPQKGSLILAPCGFTHTHRGHVPISSDKYVLASWVMYKPAQQMYATAPQ